MISLIEWISLWAQQVIVAVIIATLLEMILPNGNNKKYIKTVIGIYVLFVILSPIVSKVVNGETSFSELNYEDYLKNDEIYSTMSNNLSNEVNTDIKQTYIVSLKQDIKTKLDQKGFIASNINVQVNLIDEKQYGFIEYMIMSVTKKIEENEEDNESKNIIKVNQVNNVSIKDGKQETVKKADNITASEERQIKDFLKEEYGIKKENIKIN